MAELSDILAGGTIPVVDVATALRLVGQDYPPVDSNGNLLAAVTPRSDTLANLLAVTDAGDGEVATATDTDSQVIYKGVAPSVGVEYGKSRIVAAAGTENLLAGVATGVPLVLPLTPVSPSGISSDPKGIIDASGFLVMPKNTSFIEWSFNLGVSGYSSVPANVWKMSLEATPNLTSPSWSPAAILDIPIFAADETQGVSGIFNIASAESVSEGSAFRLVFEHNAGSNQTILVYTTAKIFAR